MKHQPLSSRRFFCRGRLFSLLLIISLFLCSCSPTPTTPETKESASTETKTPGTAEYVTDEAETEEFLSFCNQLFQSIAVENTINLHYTLADPAAYGVTDYDATLGSWDTSVSQQDHEETLDLLEELHTYNREVLSEQARITYDLLDDYLEGCIDAEPFLLYNEPLSTTSGDHINLPILLAEYAFYSQQDAQDYLALIQDMPRYFATIEEFEQAKADAGLFMSDDMVEQVVEQCQNFLADPDNNFLLVTLPERLEALTDMSDEEKAAYTALVQDAVTNCAFPAYESLIAKLTELKDTADNLEDDVTGICSLPEGQDYYEYLLKSDVGTDRSPEELKEMLQSALDKSIMIISLQYTDAVETDLSDTSDALSEPEEILQDLQGKIREEFPAVDGTAYTVKYVPTALEESTSPAFYLTPPIDRSDENVIYINQKYYDLTDIYNTLAHEGYPGHLLQTVYFNRSCDIPLRHLFGYSGYVEGWATYVEMQSYSWEDMYESRTAKVAAANQEATLCLYGLMDIGINYDGWTEDDTLDFLGDYFGIDDSEIANEIFETILGEPANYLNYVIGFLEWQDIRDGQEELLDSDFSAMEFHSRALEIGPCPFYILREYLQ